MAGELNEGMHCGVVIPAFNTASIIGEVVERVQRHTPRVLVVDDGSCDRTYWEANNAGATVLRHHENRGKGRALRTGFAWALEQGWDPVITLDSDGQHDPAEIPRFLKCYARQAADIVLGVRILSYHRMPPHRRANNRLISAVGSWLSGQKIPDFQTGYRLIRAEVLRSVQLTTERYETEAELLIKAGRLGFHIAMIPIRAIYRNEISYVKPLREMRLFTCLLIRSLIRS